jgi:hypothetical protein
MRKKAQLSIFMLLAIVIIFSFLVVFIFSKNVGTEKFQSQYKTLSEQKSAVARVESYISSCLQFSAETTLSLIGKQGGFIFKEAGSADPNTIVRRGTQVYWTIRTLNNNLLSDYHTDSSAGLTQIPLIKKEDAGNLGSKYPFIKDEIGKYAAYEFRQCMNTSLFEEKGIAIKEKNSPSITAELGNSGTTFYLSYPIEVSAGTYTEKKEKKTVYRSSVRFLTLYNIAKKLIFEDIQLSFTLDSSTANQLPYNSLSSEVYVEINPGLEYDTITIHDAKEKQKIYKLIFLRQNRAPVIRYIPDYSVNISDFLNISFVVIDPDEDNFTEKVTAEKRIITGAGGREIVDARLNFKTSASDIGYYEYNFSAADGEPRSDWQNGVVVRIKCEYYDNAVRSGDKWTAAGKAFDYNPACCENADPASPFTRLRFRDGETVGGCPCNAQGTCGAVVPVVTCDPACGLCDECVSGGCVPKTCDSGYTCDISTGECNAAACTDTCASLGYDCGIVCGINCGYCDGENICRSGHCRAEPPCICVPITGYCC